MTKRRVVVTGLGLVTPVGIGVESSWKNILNGVSGITKITKFDSSGFKSQVAGEVKNFNVFASFNRKKLEAEDLISKTLAPADLVSHMLKMAETDKEAASAVKNELNKRLQKAGLATE